MAGITIRNLDEQTKERLRVRAAHRRRSMEDEARNILRAAVAEDAVPPRNLAEAIRRRFQPLGGVELRLRARKPMREPPKPAKHRADQSRRADAGVSVAYRGILFGNCGA